MFQPPPRCLSLEGSHYWSLWKWNEWERKGTDGRSWPRGLWGVRTHKLITWYWWRTLTAISIPPPSPPTSIHFCPDHIFTGRSNFLLKWCSQTAMNNTFEDNSVWSSEISMIKKRGMPPECRRPDHHALTFHINSDWCNCKGEPLFEWVNIVIMELLWNRAFLTRRADFLPPNTKWNIHRRDYTSLKKTSLITPRVWTKNVRSCCFIHTANLLSIKRECPVTKKVTCAINWTRLCCFKVSLNKEQDVFLTVSFPVSISLKMYN